jgi:succinate dehydrogenase / fumarate reductase cytochrome b subunit
MPSTSPMHPALRYARSSVGRKQLMGLSGVVLYGFLLVHLVGNVGLLGGPEHFNQYGHLMLHTLKKVVVPVEFVLLAAFVMHLYLGFRLTAENLKARPDRYAVRASKSKRRGFGPFGAYMAASGSWLLIFVLVHVPHFRFGAWRAAPRVSYDGVEMRDLYAEALRSFANGWFTLFYAAGFALLLVHLAHGVRSSLQSLGINHPRWNGALTFASYAYAVLICGGFASLAVWLWMQGGIAP